MLIVQRYLLKAEQTEAFKVCDGYLTHLSGFNLDLHISLINNQLNYI